MQQQIYYPQQKMFVFKEGWHLLFKYINVILNTAQIVFSWFLGLANIVAEWAKNIFPPFALVALGVALLIRVLGCAVFIILAICSLVLLISCGTCLLLLMIGAILMIGLLTNSTRLSAHFFQKHYRCPNMHCYQEMKVPVYQCPHCPIRHGKLEPNIYGIFAHHCKCEHTLPTLDWIGRDALERYCASCGRQMDKEIGRGTNIDIPVIGGRSWGKTTYLTAATALLKKYYTSGPKPYTVKFTNIYYQNIFNKNLHRLRQGHLLANTIEEAPNAYCLKIQRSSVSVPKLLFFYDAAGEAFSSSSKMYWHAYYKYIRGMIFIIDPFAIAAFRRDHPRDLAQLGSTLVPERPDVEEIGNRLIEAIELYRGTRHRRHKVPVAVVVTKVDILDLENEIGLTAAQKWLAGTTPLVSIDDALQAVVREFLKKNGLNNLLEQFEAYFSVVGYFSCSALGSMPSAPDYQFVPIRTLEPLKWLLMKNGIVKD